MTGQQAAEFYTGQDVSRKYVPGICSPRSLTFSLAFNIEKPDPTSSTNYVAPPSRPPSRVNMHQPPDAPRYSEKIDLSAANTTGETISHKSV